MREGSIFRRCTACGTKMDGGRECRKCGSRSYSWSFVCDVAPPGASRQQKRGGGYPTKAAALEAMGELQAAHAKGTAVSPAKIATGDYLDLWLEAIRSQVRPSTWQARRERLDRYVKPQLGDVPLQALSELHLERLYRHLETDGRIRGEGGLSRSSVYAIHGVVHAALEDAARRRPPLVARNVAARLYRSPSDLDEDRREMTVWSVQELHTFLDHVEGDEQLPLWRTASMTGMRRGELLGLRWRDIDFVAGTVTINRARVRGADGEVTVTPPKSRRSRRTIDIDGETLRVLQELRRSQPVVNIDGLVFVRRDGQPLTPDGVTQRFDRHVRDSGLPRIRFHDLRHSHASLLLAAGEPLHVVSRRLGHSNEGFTARVYAHVMPGQQAAAVARLAVAVDRREA